MNPRGGKWGKILLNVEYNTAVVSRPANAESGIDSRTLCALVFAPLPRPRPHACELHRVVGTPREPRGQFCVF